MDNNFAQRVNQAMALTMGQLMMDKILATAQAEVTNDELVTTREALAALTRKIETS